MNHTADNFFAFTLSLLLKSVTLSLAGVYQSTVSQSVSQPNCLIALTPRAVR